MNIQKRINTLVKKIHSTSDPLLLRKWRKELLSAVYIKKSFELKNAPPLSK